MEVGPPLLQEGRHAFLAIADAGPEHGERVDPVSILGCARLPLRRTIW
jgi:hypothetical protein